MFISLNTALHLAASCFNVGMVEYLLSREGIDANVLNKAGDAPIHIAAKMNDESTMKVLCDFTENVDLNRKDSNGISSLVLEHLYL